MPRWMSAFQPKAGSDGHCLTRGVGAGEIAFGTNAYAKVEYVYTDYNGADVDDGDVVAGADVSRHQVLGGIGFRF